MCNKFILLIDDNVDDYEAAARSLRKCDPMLELHWCRTSESALEWLMERAEHNELYGIILMDLNMPGTDGRNCIQTIKISPELHMIPVIVLTTSQDEKEINNAYTLGANSYVQKPVGYEELNAALQGLYDYWFNTARLPRGEADEPDIEA